MRDVRCAQSLVFEWGPERPRIRLPSAFSQNSLGAWLLRHMPSFFRGSQAIANKPSHRVEALALMSRSQEHWPKMQQGVFWPETIPTLSPGKHTRNGIFPTGCRHSHLTYNRLAELFFNYSNRLKCTLGQTGMACCLPFDLIILAELIPSNAICVMCSSITG